MKRSVLLGCALFLMLSAAAFAQAPGHVAVTVTVAAQPEMPSTGPVSGAKIIVMHWSASSLHPTIVQDQIATTGQMGTATIELRPGVYDIFVASSGLVPAAFRREIVSGQDNSLAVNLTNAQSHLSPTH
jgi:hypothetical protein